jgi:outer membrane lipoprotein SlyB
MHTKLIPALGLMILAAGCTIPSSKPMVPAAQAGQLQTSEVGTVVKTRDVAIEGRRSQLGQYGGAVIGGAAARPAGGIGSTGGALGVAAASVVGAIAGESVEEYATRKRAQEITIQLKDGNLVTIVQEAPPDFLPGDVVEIMHGAGGARVKLYLESAVASAK